MRVLIVKLSSLGDVIHTLPALTDAAQAIPGIQFDWVIEPGFAEIPRWHPSIDTIIPFALRQWKRSFRKAISSGEIKQTWQALRHHEYDIIIDAQGLLKSGLVSILARGKTRAGYAKPDIRESIATYFYNKKIKVSFDLPADQRMRVLFAKALGYTLPTTQPDYNIDKSQFIIEKRPDNEVIFFHNTTWDTKYWLESYWVQLAGLVAGAGYQVILPWGNEAEKARANRLRQVYIDLQFDLTYVPQILDRRLTLNEMTNLMAQAKGIVTLDTGLGHVAAAMGAPTVFIYGPTSPVLTGCYGAKHWSLTPPADMVCAPCLSVHCKIVKTKLSPPCLQKIAPILVWEALERLL